MHFCYLHPKYTLLKTYTYRSALGDVWGHTCSCRDVLHWKESEELGAKTLKWGLMSHSFVCSGTYYCYLLIWIYFATRSLSMVCSGLFLRTRLPVLPSAGMTDVCHHVQLHASLPYRMIVAGQWPQPTTAEADRKSQNDASPLWYLINSYLHES